MANMAKKRTPQQRLTGRVALVAGATRGAGRGIARALAEAGAIVYCTGRSTKGHPSPYRRPETIEETAALIKAAGGTAIAVRVDHTIEDQVKALFRRIMHAHKRLDIVVDSVAGEDPLMKQYGFLWQTDLKSADAIFRQGLAHDSHDGLSTIARDARHSGRRLGCQSPSANIHTAPPSGTSGNSPGRMALSRPCMPRASIPHPDCTATY
jgi:NAD(P)-dependent dehydrogenase (short-subunit alcohol dehydrogenase family)